MGVVNNKNYIKTFGLLKERVLQAQYRSYSAVNSEMILAYLDIGKIISEKTKIGWGTSVIKQLSVDLQAEFIGMKGFSERNLHRMKLIYQELVENSISPQLVAKLPWGHSNLIFSKIKKRDERAFYLQKAKEEAWSRSILEEKIKVDTYALHQKFQNNFVQTLSQSDIAKYSLQFKDEYDLSFLNLPDHHTERQLETAIVSNITKMLGQFGSDFAFMGQQFKVELDNPKIRMKSSITHSNNFKSVASLSLSH